MLPFVVKILNRKEFVSSNLNHFIGITFGVGWTFESETNILKVLTEQRN